MVDGCAAVTATGNMSNADWLHPHNKHFELCPLLYLALPPPPGVRRQHKHSENAAIQNEDAQHRGQRYKVHNNSRG